MLYSLSESFNNIVIIDTPRRDLAKKIWESTEVCTLDILEIVWTRMLDKALWLLRKIPFYFRKVQKLDLCRTWWKWEFSIDVMQV